MSFATYKPGSCSSIKLKVGSSRRSKYWNKYRFSVELEAYIGRRECPAQFRTTKFRRIQFRIFQFREIKILNSVKFRKIRIPPDLFFDRIIDTVIDIYFLSIILTVLALV